MSKFNEYLEAVYKAKGDAKETLDKSKTIATDKSGLLKKLKNLDEKVKNNTVTAQEMSDAMNDGIVFDGE